MKLGLNNYYFWLLIIGFSLVGIIAIRRNFELTNPAIAPTQTPAVSKWKRITDTTALFYSKIFLDRDQTFVSIPLKFDGDTQVTWVSFMSTESAVLTDWLVAHPTLEQLDWPSINDQRVYLYQRKRVYKNIPDFLNKPPAADKLMVEKSIKNVATYSQVSGQDLIDSFDPKTVDFILTTYRKPRIENDTAYYENIIDASTGLINSNEKLTWLINVPKASQEIPFYIGEIHVDYR